jgi:antitoxin (DNA-binding transcriptional repressor) of toxin-antitoxin stability system
MRVTTIRELKHDTTTVLGWVAAGESVEVRRRNKPVAVLSPPGRKKRPILPDFKARLREIYGDHTLPTTGSELIAQSRGDS